MKIVMLSLLLAITLPSAAQQEKAHDKGNRKKMAAYLPSVTRSVGGSFQRFNQLNDRIANFPQYKQLKGYTPTLGLGWMKEKNQLISDMGLTLGSSLSGHKDEKSSTIRYIGLNANIGYDVVKDKKISLYPLAGIGFQTYQAIFYKDNSGVDFNDVLSSPANQNSIRPVKFKNEFLLYRIGAGISFTSPKHPHCSIGLQTGYTGSFEKRAWKSNEYQSLGNAPKDRISQFYISLILTNKPWMMMK